MLSICGIVLFLYNNFNKSPQTPQTHDSQLISPEENPIIEPIQKNAVIENSICQKLIKINQTYVLNSENNEIYGKSPLIENLGINGKQRIKFTNTFNQDIVINSFIIVVVNSQEELGGRYNLTIPKGESVILESQNDYGQTYSQSLKEFRYEILSPTSIKEIVKEEEILNPDC